MLLRMHLTARTGASGHSRSIEIGSRRADGLNESDGALVNTRNGMIHESVGSR
jgi:hypothetical protein